jgi:hypothetical protein
MFSSTITLIFGPHSLVEILFILAICLWLLIQLVSESTTFTTTMKLVLCVILIINVCSHICDYWNHICDYNVDITKWNWKCGYSLWLLHVYMEKNESAHFFIQYWMDTLMDENLVAFTTGHNCFGSLSLINFPLTIPW